MKLSKHYNRKEFACNCGCGFDTIDYELLIILEDISEHFGQRVFVNSGCRCESYNKKIGGAEKSQHKTGRAADVVVEFILPCVVYKYINNQYPSRFGIGNYKTFTHVDTRNVKARW